MINVIVNKINEVNEPANLKEKYPIVKKRMFEIDKRKFIKKTDLNFRKRIWCK